MAGNAATSMPAAIFLLRGLLIGFAIAAPVRPIGLLCIQRTLRMVVTERLCQRVWGSIGRYGLRFHRCLWSDIHSTFLIEQQRWLSLIGGLFCSFLGVKTFLTPQTGMRLMEFRPKKDSLTTAYLSTFLLTLTNPVTILSFVAIFAGLDYRPKPAIMVRLRCSSSAYFQFRLHGGCC